MEDGIHPKEKINQTMDSHSEGNFSPFKKLSDLMSQSYAHIPETFNEAVDAASQQLTNAWSYLPSLSSPDFLGGLGVFQVIEAPAKPPTPQTSSRTRRNNFALYLPFKNPYSSQREPKNQNETMATVRYMLSYIPPEQQLQHAQNRLNFSYTMMSQQDNEEFLDYPDTDESSIPEKSIVFNQNTNFVEPIRTSDSRHVSRASSTASNGKDRDPSYDAQTASRLAEGTIRAFRDLALEEAVELNGALQYWTERWERPVLSWLEAGPTVWFSKEGYRHQQVGQKVSQIQAVLARRCASIGELQQHLWRAGWQQGVAQWGVIGEGTKWATVVGGDGAIDSLNLESIDKKFHNSPVELLPHPTEIGSLNVRESHKHTAAKVTVRRTKGGEILANDPAFVIWTVDALRMVRDQLYRTGDGLSRLPHYENWPQEQFHFDKDRRTQTENENFDKDYLPLWATNDADPTTENEDNVVISNLPMMATEVSHLLDAMENQLQEHRNRRSQVLRPMSRLRRSWYVGTVVVPLGSYVLYKLIQEGHGILFCLRIWSNLCEFYEEHVADPVAYVYRQLFVSRVQNDIADKVARKQAIESLKIMLKDWLAQSYPKMEPKEVNQIAESMDMTLIEKKKEESVKTALWEINDIVHMSLIEMQFIKKELFNAMVSMDELMQSNEFNFKLAAMTPAFVVVYGLNKVFKFLFYALLQLGKSREQIHEQIRLVVIDMERLLVMRDCPPSAPPPLDWHDSKRPKNAPASESTPNETPKPGPPEENVLNSDDLGMLMLLIHECRTIMLQNRRRFSLQEFRSMAEDLAELAGERGPVSVKQQLLIVSRMFRTYSFLKVVSSGVSLDISRYVDRQFGLLF